MPRLQAKTFGSPDEVRDLPKLHADLVELDEATVGLSRFEPGWQWSKDLRPTAGTDSCQFRHLGYSMSGTLHVVMNDGQTLDIRPGSVYEIPVGHDATVVSDEPFVTLEWTSARTVGVPMDGPGQRVLATVLFTDIVDSTATLDRLGDKAWGELLRTHNARLREALNTFRGREIKTTGDGILAVFDSATRAVRWGLAMTRAHDLGIAIRVGVHSGEVEFVGGDARGVAVHAAARVLGLAGPDEVLVSSTTHDLLEGSGLRFESAGTHELKAPGARPIYRLVA